MVKVYLGGKIKHYLRKPRTVTLVDHPYTTQEGDNMYSLALRLFGENSMYFWTIIADNSRLKMPDEWEPGQLVNMPEIVLNDLVQQAPNYESASQNSSVL